MFTVSLDSVIFRSPSLPRTLEFALDLAIYFEGAVVTISGGPVIL